MTHSPSHLNNRLKVPSIKPFRHQDLAILPEVVLGILLVFNNKTLSKQKGSGINKLA